MNRSRQRLSVWLVAGAFYSGFELLLRSDFSGIHVESSTRLSWTLSVSMEFQISGFLKMQNQKTTLFALSLSLLMLLVGGCTRKQNAPVLLASPSDWPHPVQNLFDELVGLDPSTEMDGHLLYGGPGPNSIGEAVFRVHDVNAEILDLLKVTLDLTSIDPKHELGEWGKFVVENSSDEWWPTETQVNIELFASQGLLDGEEGDLYIVAHEPSTNTIYICYHFNF